MKRIFFLIGLFVLSLGSKGQLLLHEPFNYTADPTNGLHLQSSGVWQRLNTGDSILVDNTSLTYSGLAASTGNKVKFEGLGSDNYRIFTSQTSGSVYSSFILNVSALGSLDATGGYFIGFSETGSNSLFGAVVWTRLSATAGKYNIGISTRSSTSPISWLPTDLDPGTSYFVVTAYDMIAGTANDVARIWLNTTAIGGSEPAADATSVAATDLLSVERIFLRQDSPAETAATEVDEIRVGTTWASVTPAASASPSLSISSPLTAFGNVCINTTAGPNSFTISGSNLMSTDVVVSALPGFTYSTTSGGTYTASLTIPQGGGAFSQQVFVKFDPTAVQSYSGNIVIGGGGATSVNAVASGAGVNTAPTVTSGAPGAITQNSASVAGSVTDNGCSAVTAYGIEYSTTAGFANGTGTAVASTNIAAGSYTSALSGLATGTTYYYHAYATNAGGTSYGAEQSFTTATPNPTITTTALTAFGNVCINTTAGPNSFTINGTNLTAADVTVAALTGFTYSTTASGTYTAALTLTQPGGTFSQDVFVKFDPAAVQSYNGNIVVNGGGIAVPVNAAAAGAGVNPAPSVTSGSASAITQISATVAGTITATGCTAVTAYGIEYSTTAGFANGTGTAVASTNLSGANFSSAIPGLSLATTYYYHAYATNGAGTSYGAEASFTTSSSTPVAGVVISQVYGGGGNASATYNQDFVELFNAGTTTVDISGWSVQYASATGPAGAGNWAVAAIPASTTIAPGKYYLVALATGGTGVALPAADVTNTTINLSGTVGKVALVNNSTALNGTMACSNAAVADVLGYGSTATCFETAFFSTTGIDNTKSMFRKNNGCTDAGNNSTDFEILAVSPRNSASPANTCGSASPVLSVSSTLAAFGNICINTTAGPNTFTVSGSNLTTENVTITCPVGFTVADNAAGPYASVLFHPQPGGAFSQQYFVKFDPTLVQSYNNNILVAGGGVSTPVSMPATGAGVNTAPSVTSGVASAITQTSATVAGSITDNGCTAVTAYGIEYSTTAGFVNGTGTAVASTNLAGGNFSSDLTSLATGTTYYYHAYATNAGGTSYGAEQSFTTATPNPTINVTALTAFGNICINTTAGPNSFTISGSNLTTADVTVAALAGYTYSTTAGGTYTTTLTLTQPGGTYSQEIFVQFAPTAVQSYNGNIVVNGGGIAAAVNVAASGAGVNTAPSVTSGAVSAITQTTATVAGSITATGCTAVTAYGIEYSTTNNFPNGTGTQVASTNLAAGNFSSALSGLTTSTVYYYKAYATNAGGTTYGTQQTFTTAAPPPPAITVTALNGFGSTCINTEAGPNSFVINGTNLTTANITVGPLAGYTFAETAGGTYTASLSITQTGGTQSKNVYVKFTPTAVQAYNGNIPVTGGGVTATINVAAAGTGVNTVPTVTTGAASNITTSSVVLSGTAVGNGCTALTELGFEYSGINGFADGTGTKVLSTAAFSTQVTGLVQGATYYYKAYAKNAGGTGYGAQQSFTITAIPDEFRIFPVPAQAGAELKFSISNLKPGYYALLFLDAEGKLVYQKNINLQATFINQAITLPLTISKGTYRVQLVNTDDIIATKTILIL